MWILTRIKFLRQTFGQTLDFPVAIIETISLQIILQNMPSNYLMKSFWKIGQTNCLYHLLILDDMAEKLPLPVDHTWTSPRLGSNLVKGQSKDLGLVKSNQIEKCIYS